MNNDNLTPYGKLCKQFPDGKHVKVLTNDGREFEATCDGEGNAWVQGNCWIHPTRGFADRNVIDNCLTWEVAKDFIEL